MTNRKDAATAAEAFYNSIAAAEGILRAAGVLGYWDEYVAALDAAVELPQRLTGDFADQQERLEALNALRTRLQALRTSQEQWREAERAAKLYLACVGIPPEHQRTAGEQVDPHPNDSDPKKDRD